LGLQRLIRRFRLLPESLRNVEALLPDRPAPRPLRERIAPAIGEYRGRVAFFHGCVQDAFLGDVNAATIRVLQRNGYEVHMPAAQTCCGAAQLHVGEEEFFLGMARQNIDSFEAGQYEAIINNAGGCGSTLKEYGHLLRNDPDYAGRARDFCGKVRDISEFLLENLHRPPMGVIHARAVYADSCHLRHVQKVVQQPRDLLKLIPGLELLELTKPDRCCGSAGLYNIMQPQAAGAILDEKMEDILSTRPDLIVTTNTGCHLQLMNGARRAGIQAYVVHLVELLDRSYAAEEKNDAQ
jgi:glycolate oxidase iron-sulfur subunit